ncbi:MAG TPA: hypothetical protein VMX16_11665 [Terriglobia bacterium]|nr:hypothetical protein [Terriglobia bacterium]
MKLREHPKLKGKWPPQWEINQVDGPVSPNPEGEQGVLKDVKRYWLESRGHLALFIRHNGQRYLGQMEFNDKPFQEALYTELIAELKRCDSIPIEKVGDLDIGF